MKLITLTLSILLTSSVCIANGSQNDGGPGSWLRTIASTVIPGKVKVPEAQCLNLNRNMNLQSIELPYSSQLVIKKGAEVTITESIQNSGTLIVEGTLILQGQATVQGGVVVVADDATVSTAHPFGLSSRGALSAEVVQLSEAATYIFNAEEQQETGHHLPNKVAYLIIDNDMEVHLTSDVEVAKDLVLTKGTLMIGTHNLTLFRHIKQINGSLEGNRSSQIKVRGDGASLKLPKGIGSLDQLQILRPSGVRLTDKLDIQTALKLNGGPLFIREGELNLAQGARVEHASNFRYIVLQDEESKVTAYVNHENTQFPVGRANGYNPVALQLVSGQPAYTTISASNLHTNSPDFNISSQNSENTYRFAMGTNKQQIEGYQSVLQINENVVAHTGSLKEANNGELTLIIPEAKANGIFHLACGREPMPAPHVEGELASALRSE